MTVFRGARSALDVLDAIEDEDAAVDTIFIAPPRSVWSLTKTAARKTAEELSIISRDGSFVLPPWRFSPTDV